MLRLYKALESPLTTGTITTLLMLHNGLTISETVLIGSLLMFITALLEIPTGYFGDKYGSLLSLKLVSIAELVSLVGLFYINTTPGVLVYVVFYAIAVSLSSGSFSNYTANHIGVEDATNYNNKIKVLTTIGQLRFFIYLVVLGALFDHSANLPLYFIGIVMILKILVTFNLPEVKHNCVKRSYTASLKKSLSNKTLLIVMLSTSIGIVISRVNSTYSTVFFNELNISGTAQSTILGSFSIINLMIPYVYSKVYDKIKSRIIDIMLLLYISGLLVTVLTTNLVGLLTGQIILLVPGMLYSLYVNRSLNYYAEPDSANMVLSINSLIKTLLASSTLAILGVLQIETKSDLIPYVFILLGILVFVLIIANKTLGSVSKSDTNKIIDKSS